MPITVENVPSGHNTHSCMSVALIFGKYMFKAHGEHCDDIDDPINVDHVDVGQATHDAFVVADIVVEYVPASQGMH